MLTQRASFSTQSPPPGGGQQFGFPFLNKHFGFGLVRFGQNEILPGLHTRDVSAHRGELNVEQFLMHTTLSLLDAASLLGLEDEYDCER